MQQLPVRNAALGDQVAELLRFEIVSGRRVPGEHLTERVLSEQFSVSRGPIRDALRTLEAEGLIETASRGVSVRGLSGDDISELYSLRTSIESLAVRRCLEAFSEVNWDRFDGPLERMEEAVAQGDHRSFALADLDYHTLFYELSSHRRLLSVWMSYQPTFRALFETTTAQDSDLHGPNTSHHRLLDIMRSGDAERALTELADHLDGARTLMISAHAAVRASAEAAGSAS